MKLTRFLGSKRSRQLSAATTLYEAVKSFRGGQKKLAALLAGAAALSYKRSELGYLAQAVVKLYKKRA